MAAKFVYPIVLFFSVYELVTPYFTMVFGDFLGTALAFSTLWLAPDIFGFLFWEMKENWKLYRANRQATLQPAIIGAARRDDAAPAQAGLPLGHASQAIYSAAPSRTRGSGDRRLAGRAHRPGESPPRRGVAAPLYQAATYAGAVAS